MNISITECPRDAMQGLQSIIPTVQKIEYLNLLSQVGFTILDAGSFVSAKAIPQMADSKEVFENITHSKSNLLAIVANERGAKEALLHPNIEYLGFPLSISETFQQRNTNKSIAEAIAELKKINELANLQNKKTRVYLSMGFGNPYGDDFSISLLLDFVNQLINLGISHIVPSDTTGSSTPNLLNEVYSQLQAQFPNNNFGCHLHATYDEALAKIEAAFEAGVKDFDSAFLGFGGCPMASNSLTGNIPTEILVDFLEKKGVDLGFDLEKFEQAKWKAQQIFY